MARHRTKPGFAGSVGIAAAALAFTVPATPAGGQIPDEFTNLQFFDEEISRGELIGYMRQFSFALGVRCQYCHSGGDGVSFEGVEFASDDKPEKLRARYMLEMARTINSTLLVDVPERRSPNVDVGCATCHRGIARPRMIADVIRETITADGAEAGVTKYRELHDEYSDGWSYDFGEWAINDLASEYGRAEDPETAAVLMRMNSEFHPGSPSVWTGLGDAENLAGNRDAAIAAYQKGLELSPDNPQILRRLEELGVGG